MTTTANSDDIAIIGMAAMFAGAPNANAYWENILDEVDAIRVASDSWALSYFDPDSSDSARTYTRKGGFLDEQLEFDPTEFGIMPSTIPSADTDHFLALKLASDALEDAGYGDRPFDRTRTGVILGRGNYFNRGVNTLVQHGQTIDQVLDFLKELHPELEREKLDRIRTKLHESLPPFTGEVVSSLIPNIITGRIANRLDLMGTNYTIDAACASSLIAIESAILELRSGRCDMVLTGGTHATVPAQHYMVFCQLNAMSRSHPRPFDSEADGMLHGEGLGIVVLKRIGDAERDGDRIYAVVKGVGSSSDGRAVGLLAPRMEGQLLALQRAYELSGIDPDTIALIEAHGTGIPIGDKTEVETLTRLFGARGDRLPRRALGSVKSMVGHCIAAAGIAGFIKTAFALHDKILPATLCETVNPDLEIDRTSFYVNNRTRPWIHDGRSHPRRAGVNAFGFGGVNAHAILEEYRPPNAAPQPLAHSRWPSELLLFAASDRAGLIERLKHVQGIVKAQFEVRLSDLAYTLADQVAGSHRLAIVCQDVGDLTQKLETAVAALADEGWPRLPSRAGLNYGDVPTEAERGRTAFLFPGEGGQHHDMLADMCLHLPCVRTWFDLLDESLVELSQVPPSQVIFPPPTSLSDEEIRSLEGELMSLEMRTAAVFTASMAMYELLTALGVRCDAMVGHSTGEGSALVAAGIVRLSGRSDLLAGLAQFYGTFHELARTDQVPQGVMLSVGAVDSDLLEQLVESFGGRLHIALENCPNQTVLFGAREDIDKVAERLTEHGAICKPLPFDRAYHTPLVVEVEPILRGLYERLEVGPGHVPVYSCATTEPFPTDPDDVRELATRQWRSRIRFRQTVENLHTQGVRTFIEVGPGGNLTAFVRDTLQGRSHLALASNAPGKSSLMQFQQLVAQLFVSGADLDLNPLFTDRRVNKVPVASNSATTSNRPNRSIRLEQIMPRLQLSGEIIEEIRSGLATESSGSAASDAFSGAFQNGANASDRGACESSVSGSIAAPQERQSIDPRAEGILAHFDLMREFLGSQARVMTQLGIAVPPQFDQPEPALSRVFQEPRPRSTEEQWPLLGKVVEHDASNLVCKRHITLNHDVFLRDHTLGGAPSARAPELIPLPVVPFTISMEIAAEAASCLDGGTRRVVRLYELRANRFLALDRGELTLLIRASLMSERSGVESTDVHVRIFEVSTAKEDENQQPVFEGRVQLSDRFPPSPAPMPFELVSPQAPHYTREMLYGSKPTDYPRYVPFFHGPRFQAVTGIRRWGGEGIEADITTFSTADFFAGVARPAFQIDPILLDAAGQLVVYWVAERFGVDLSFFPLFVQDYRQYADPPAPGSRILCRAAVRVIDNDGRAGGFEFLDRDGRVLARLSSDDEESSLVPDRYETCRLYPSDAYLEATLELLDDDGRVISIFRGWRDRYFSIPHRFYRCRTWPQSEFLSEAWMQAETGRICRRIEVGSGSYLEQGRGLWKRVLAHLMLSWKERDYWYSLPERGRRRTEWLLGRVAAKDAVRQWAQERHGLQVAPADVEILADTLGKPVVRCTDLVEAGSVPEVSISHNRNCIVATVSESDTTVGIDVACLEDVHSIDTLKQAFSERELELLNNTADGEREVSVLHFWCAKEAASKAHGSGLGGEPRNWVIDDYVPGEGEITVCHDGVSYRVRVWQLRDEVLALC